jgi:ribose-phosphate pyrophosphokinase
MVVVSPQESQLREPRLQETQLSESQLASQLASSLKTQNIQVNVKKFSDSETYIEFEKLEAIKNSTVLLVQQFFSFITGSKINDQLVDFIILADALKKAGAKKIVAVLPYLPYARQRLNFEGTVLGPALLWGKIFKNSGVDLVLSCDLHELSICDVFETQLINISTAEFWADFLKTEYSQLIQENAIILVSPDHGGIQRVEAVAKLLNLSTAFIEKTRSAPNAPVALTLHGAINHSYAIIIDDIFDTGKTAMQACHILKTQGVKSITGLFTHAIFSDWSEQKIFGSCFEKIVVTDTILFDGLGLNAKLQINTVNQFLVNKINKLLK